MALNQISTATNGGSADTKIYRRALKLDEAKAKRQAVGTPGYRPLHNINGTHSAYVNGTGGATLSTLSGSASPTTGHPWSTGTVATYGVEFRTYNTATSTAGDTTSTCNEGSTIWFDFYGSGIPDLPDAYIQFSGANITNQDAQTVFPNLVDPYPFNVYQMTGPNLPPPPTFGAPILINADNLTEGNETLTLTWYINSTTIATATSITIVDTSQTPITPLLSLDAGDVTSYASQHVVTVASLSNGGTALHIPKAFDANIGNQVSAGYPVVTQWGGYHSTVTSVTTGTGGFGEEWIISIQRDVSIGFSSGSNATFGNDSVWTDTIGGMPFTLQNGVTYNNANGGYLQFNPGNSQYAESIATLGTLANWTIEAWHYYDGTNTAAGDCIFTETYGGGDINLTLGSTDGSAGDLQTAYFRGGWHATNSGYKLTTSTWHHVVGTYDGVALKLYVDGALVNSTTEAGPVGSDGGQGYRLMSRWDPGGYWGGRLGVVRVYNTSTNQAYIANTYNTEKSRYGL